MFAHEEGAREIDGNAPVPVGKGKLVHRRIGRVGEAGVVHQGVEPAEASDRGAHAGLDRGLLRYIAANKRELRFPAGFRVDVRHRHVVAPESERLRRRLADALCASGDQRGLFRHTGKEYS